MKYTQEDKALVYSLLIIRNKASCVYTHWRAVQEYCRVKYALAKRIGDGPVVYLGHELLEIDPLCIEMEGSLMGITIIWAIITIVGVVLYIIEKQIILFTK